jgi:trehalose 6-phosphate synthase
MAGLLVCSHRGPVIFSPGPGGVRLEPAGPGGLVASVAPAVEKFGGTWLFASASAAEADLGRQVPGGIARGPVTYRLVDLPQAAHRDHYATISTELLMPLFHYLLPLADQPAFTARTAAAWDNYRLVNARYAAAIAAHGDADAVLVEDVHLMLAGAAVATAAGRRPAAPVSYFHHVPWCEPSYFGVLPAPVRREILSGLLAYDSVGFHCRRWAEAFWACCERFVPDADRAGDVMTHQGHQTRLVISPVAIDTAQVAEVAGSSQAREWRQRFAGIGAGRRLIVRVERADPAKNTVRGLAAFGAMLERRPDLAEQACLLAVLTPVRLWMPEYRGYLDQCEAVAAQINERFEAAPVQLHLGGEAHSYDHQRALAGLSLAHTVMATSVYDGCNLVAMEAMFAGGQPALVLSENTGAHAWFGEHTLPVNPFDVAQTASALELALDEPAARRQARAAALRGVIADHTPADWIRDRLAGLWEPRVAG